MSLSGSSTRRKKHCRICGAQLSRYNTDDLCWPCQEVKQTLISKEAQASSSSLALSASHSSTFTLRSILDTVRKPQVTKLSTIGQELKIFRTTHHLTQRELADLLEFDQSYISKLENGQGLRDITVLKEIANRLALSPHRLGLTNQEYIDTLSIDLLEVAPSVIRLAQTARESGRAYEAINELWPLLLRLETFVAQNRESPRVRLTLAAGQATLGVILGDLLPEEDLWASVHFFKKAVALVEDSSDDRLKSEVYRGCGNELRKHKQFTEAILYLDRALYIAPDSITKGMAAALLARTYGEMGDREHFYEVMKNVLQVQDKVLSFTPTFNPVMIHEVHLRGLMSVGDFNALPSLVEQKNVALLSVSVAPQWHVISQLTFAEALFHIGKFDDGLAKMQAALIGAQLCKLPHQVQRAIRSLRIIDTYSPAKPVAENAQTLLGELSHQALQLAISHS